MKQTMKECMLEQPETIRNVLKMAGKQLETVTAVIGSGPFEKIYLVGSGTSLHAAIAAKYAFTRWIDAEIQVFTPFEFLYYFPHQRLNSQTLVLGISQTARSIGTINCMELCSVKIQHSNGRGKSLCLRSYHFHPRTGIKYRLRTVCPWIFRLGSNKYGPGSLFSAKFHTIDCSYTACGL